MIRLYVIEDHLTVIISSLKYLFRSQRDGIEVKGFSPTVEEAIEKADPGLFDLIVLDLYIPGHKPIENIRKLKEHFPGKPVAIFTSETSSSWKDRMMSEGAMTYITKDARRDELKVALQKAARGEIFYFVKEESIDNNVYGNDHTPETHKITPVQREIINLLSKGMVHKDISEKIGISRSMVEKILKNLRKSSGVKKNIELVKLFSNPGTIL